MGNIASIDCYFIYFSQAGMNFFFFWRNKINVVSSLGIISDIIIEERSSRVSKWHETFAR